MHYLIDFEKITAIETNSSDALIAIEIFNYLVSKNASSLKLAVDKIESLNSSNEIVLISTLGEKTNKKLNGKLSVKLEPVQNFWSEIRKSLDKNSALLFFNFDSSVAVCSDELLEFNYGFFQFLQSVEMLLSISDLNGSSQYEGNLSAVLSDLIVGRIDHFIPHLILDNHSGLSEIQDKLKARGIVRLYLAGYSTFFPHKFFGGSLFENALPFDFKAVFPGGTADPKNVTDTGTSLDPPKVQLNDYVVLTNELLELKYYEGEFIGRCTADLEADRKNQCENCSQSDKICTKFFNTVSRKHAKILFSKGNCHIKPLSESKNITKLNGVELERGKEHAIKTGDQLEFSTLLKLTVKKIGKE